MDTPDNCYPGTDVLINKKDILDFEELERYERLMTTERGAQSPPEIDLTAQGYARLHHHLFQDVYDWAGKARECDIAKADAMFCRVDFVEQELERRMEAVRRDHEEKKLVRKQEFAKRAAEHVSELNAIHPFREGNGRTMRLFLKTLAAKAGHKLDLRRINPDRWHDASVRSFKNQDYAPMEKLIEGALCSREKSKTRARIRKRDDRGRGRGD